ncbi:hypothetical protein ACHHYP_13164 [Achlya hypogyna]|uniref:ATP-binding Cassette (ABC) Superfamily n=1 Tax=Achlya hypogyna TaxID=1202772 RepID=A0A1V9ZFV9_ACHHY|nr:hypothetical protein ACHHYP_13164 [Achlya hypogyna]
MDPVRWWCGNQPSRAGDFLAPLHLDRCVRTTLCIASGWKFGILGLGAYVGHTCKSPATPRSAYVVLGASLMNAAFGAFYLASHAPLSPSHVYAGTLCLVEGLHTATILWLHPAAGRAFRYLFLLDALVRLLALPDVVHAPISSYAAVLVVDSAVLLSKAAFAASLPRTRRPSTPERAASLLSRLLFTWIWPVLSTGTEADLPPLHPQDAAAGLYQRFTRSLRGHPDRNLLGHLHATCWQPFYAAAALLVLSTTGHLLTPFALQRLLEALDSAAPAHGLRWATALTAAVATKALFEHQFWAAGVRCGLHTRSLLQQHVLRKALLLSASARRAYTPGAVANLLAMDAAKLADATVVCALHWDTWSAAVAVAVAVAALWRLLGAAMGVWLLGQLLYVPVAVAVGRQLKGASARHQARRDARAAALAAALAAPKTLKGAGFEAAVLAATTRARDAELAALRAKQRCQAANASALAGLQLLAPLATFAVAVVVRPLDAPTTFAALAWFATAAAPLVRLPQVIAKLLDASVSLGRLERFFSAEERAPPSPVPPTTPIGAIDLRDAAVRWAHEAPPVLRHLSIAVPPGGVVRLEGPMGSGKSTFLELFLRLPVVAGTVVVHGDVAYCPQSPWILDVSVRDNIVLGQPWDRRWYETALAICALADDIARWPGGDRMAAGDNGAALSGGQKQRVSLARAIYARRDILLVDDIFASLDSRVAARVLASLLGHPAFAHVTKLLVLHPSVVLPPSVVTHLRLEKDVRHGHATVVRATERNAAGADAVAVASGAIDAPSQATAAPPLTRQTAHSVEPSDLEASPAVGVWRAYIDALVPWRDLAVYLALLVLEHAGLAGTTWALARWATTAAPPWTYVGLCVGTCVAGTAQRWLFVDLGLRGGRQLHASLVVALLQAPLTFLERQSAGAVLSRCVKDVSAVDEALPATLAALGTQAPAVVATIIAVAVAAPVALVAVAVLAWPYAALYRLYRGPGRALQRRERAARGPVLAWATQAITGHASVAAYGPSAVLSAFEARVDAAVQATWLATVANQWVTVWLDALGTAVVLALAVATTLLRANGALSMATASLVLVYAVQLPARMGWTIKLFAGIDLESVSIARVLELTAAAQPPDWPARAPRPLRDASVQLVNLGLAYPGVPGRVLDAISLTVPSGAKVAIIGRTGAGKSSLAQAIVGLSPYDGTVLLGGVSLVDLAAEQLLAIVGYVPQDAVLLGDTLRDALSVPGATDPAMWAVLRRVGMADRVRRLDMPLDRAPWSAGERQLLSLARALLRDANVLVCDEATAHVDAATHARVLDVVIRLPGVTVLMVTHRVEDLGAFDLVVELEQGRLVRVTAPG